MFDDESWSGTRYHFHYVDEAGDPNLFNRKKRVIVGNSGCSKFFILGSLEVVDPETLANRMTELRLELLRDPYFAGVPSMQPGKRKTAVSFHAKDDPAEVRREVFKILREADVRFHAFVRDKSSIVEWVRQRNSENSRYRYHPNQLYDDCPAGLFRGRLSDDHAHRVVFATRGTSPRTAAFREGLETARRNGRRQAGSEAAKPIEVVASNPRKIVCLQAVDYFLWAVQRCYERNERRYLELLWSKIATIHDRDDNVTYSDQNPMPADFPAGRGMPK